MAKTKNPGISIVMATLNSARTLEACLRSIQNQNYPKNRLEILMLDGGTTDKSLDIVKKFKNLPIKIINAGFKDNQEARRFLGFKKAKFEYIASIDTDNYLGGKDWFVKMVKPLEENKDLSGSFTLHYEYDPKTSISNRYFSLIGGNDPVSFYLKKNDREMYTNNSWGRQNQIIKKNKDYTVVQFKESDFPTLGANGFLVRKEHLDFKNMSPESFFHIDTLYDLLVAGYNKYAVVDVPLIHDTSPGVINFIKKRIFYVGLHHSKLKNLRRYKVFDQRRINDRLNLLKFVFFTVTFIQPIWLSVTGYFKKKDLAWFIHPIMCWVFLIGYTYMILTTFLDK